jgi:hypothetical protein
VRVVPTNEDLMVARHTRTLLFTLSGKNTQTCLFTGSYPPTTFSPLT